MHAGTSGYGDNAAELIGRYEALDFAQKHAALLPFLPPRGSHAMDVGAGAGGDAAWLAARGHHVVAVEPTQEFRAYASARHASPRIEWVEDSLPLLARVTRERRFDLVIVSAVWTHLSPTQRAVAMPVVAAMLAPRGVLYISLRHGPVPEGREMFDVQPDETVMAAQAAGLTVALRAHKASLQAINRDAGVTWTQLAFTRDR